jgi:hypothetical protein
LSIGEWVSNVCPLPGVRLAVDQVRDRLVAEAFEEILRTGDCLVERAAHAALASCAAALRSRRPLRKSRVSESISWISTVSASGRALNTTSSVLLA